ARPRKAPDPGVREPFPCARARDLGPERQAHVDIGGAPHVDAGEDEAPLIGRQAQMPAPWQLRALGRRRDHIDDHIAARIDDANRFILQHDVAVATVNRRETNDRCGQRMQPYRARHGGADVDGDVELAALDLPTPQKMLATFRVLLFARLPAICRLRLAGLVGGPALGGLALLPITIRALSLVLIAFAGRPLGLLLVVGLTLASRSILAL